MPSSTKTATSPTIITHLFSDSTPLFSFHYFDFAGKADALRLAAYYSGCSFADVRYTRDEFKDVKSNGTMPFGQLPLLTTPDGAFVPQTNAILRVIARLGSKPTLYPVDDVITCGKIDAILDLDADVYTSLLVHNYKERFGFDFLNDPSQADNLKDVRMQLKNRVLPAHLTNMENQVGAGGWLGTDSSNPSIADFNWAIRLNELRTALPDGMSLDILEPFPKLTLLVTKFKELPEVVEYYSLVV